eukprot:11200774-Lingulodinium_polyedra.AAC.1
MQQGRIERERWPHTSPKRAPRTNEALNWPSLFGWRNPGNPRKPRCHILFKPPSNYPPRACLALRRPEHI